ncbi:hypothetical protein GCM10027578_18300 [Spirosoma luteolum]
MTTITVDLIDEKAYRLLEDLAELNIIRIHPPVPATTTPEAGKPRFGFARTMIGQIADDFNEPLDVFADYQP